MNSQASSHDCKQELNNSFLKATPTRIAVMRFLEEKKLPVDVGSIIHYLKVRKIRTNQATVFRIVNKLTENGLTVEVNLNEGKKRYEIAGGDTHHHLICENCGAIEDILKCDIKDLERKIEKEKGFRVEKHALEFFGICKNCN